MQAIYAKKDYKEINFGMIITDVFVINNEISGKVNGITYRFAFGEVYFPNHPQGYNQPCFK